MNTCPCGCGAAVPVYPACASCARSQHPDCLGPDGRCVACWEAELVPSERHLETTRLMRRALVVMGRRYGDWRAGVRYPSWPWARRRFVAYAHEVRGGEPSAAVEATGPRVLLRRVARVLRSERAQREAAPCSR